MNPMLQKHAHPIMNPAKFQLQKVYQTDRLTVGHRNTSSLQKLIRGCVDFGERTTRTVQYGGRRSNNGHFIAISFGSDGFIFSFLFIISTFSLLI